ncbi:hypothetical protein SteCoe_19368 [Stentor coeruleus]|uniref:Cytochrome b5 heme-binding domain-containing protein n=1 Tax=Stentor coeruleus TaxID=5963 RepID=A0A1R2BUX2_9CILI|nr:hypothetical protein SteCoe_19368 [Stentor coeruleus]
MIILIGVIQFFLRAQAGETLRQDIDSVMTLEWTIVDDAWINIRLLCKIQLGYCSIGLRSSMTDCDMIAAINDGKSITLTDYWSRDHNTPLDDLAEGGTDDIYYISGGLDDSKSIDVTFKRKLSTGDIYDQDIIPDIRGNICWGYRNNRKGWTLHSTYGDASFSWASTQSNIYFSTSKQQTYNHGIAMSLSWLFFSIIGIFISRYFKHTFWWLYVHILLLFISSFITIISSSLLYKDDMYPASSMSKKTFDHSRIGMIMSSIVISQCAFGFLSLYIKIFTKNLQLLTILIRAHKITGYSLLICGLINCFYGWDIYKDKIGLVLTVLVYIISILVFGGFEVYQVLFKNKRKINICKLPQLTHEKAMEMIKNGAKLIFADDLVLNVKYFMLSHPGGRYMINECIGEDTGKYMVGCSSYGENMLPYTHTEKALSYYKNLAIAIIPSPAGYITSPTNTSLDLMEFTLASKKALNDSIYLISLKSDDFKMSNKCKELIWIGKHFMVIHFTKFRTIRRYYSAIFVDLINWASKLGIINTKRRNEDGHIQFIYKVYSNGHMSNYLNSLKTGDNIIIKGPFGPGLMLNEFKGSYLAFCGGTGLVPFLDLIYCAWKQGSKIKNFSFGIFVFFRSWKEGFALDILEKIRDSGKFPWLDIHIFLDDKSDLVKKTTDLVKIFVGKNVKLAWICGPSGFNRYYCEFLVQNGLERDKIVLM